MSPLPLAGKTIAIIHPAWRICGSYKIVVGQLEAYRAFGAHVVSIAVHNDPGYAGDRAWMWKSYTRDTPELDLAPRAYAGAPFHRVLRPGFLKNALWPYLHGDQAAIRLGMTQLAKLSPGVAEQSYDLVQCNHFFCMPLAMALARGKAPIILDSHDFQTRQFMLMNEGARRLPPHTTYDAMLQQELAWMRPADLLVHLNTEECAAFAKLLPEKKNIVIYPTTAAINGKSGGDSPLIVASDNHPNVESLQWFLREVAPLLDAQDFCVVGTVSEGLRAAYPDLHEAYKAHLKGNVRDLGAYYDQARMLLMPTVSGTGVSFKTMEALSSGLPMVATRAAFRGMMLDPTQFPNIRLAETPQEFAAAIAALRKEKKPTEREMRDSATRKAYDDYFSPQAYQTHLLRAIEPLLTSG